MKILWKYGRFSGYTLNKHKTQVLAFHFVSCPKLIDEHQFDWHDIGVGHGPTMS